MTNSSALSEKKPPLTGVLVKYHSRIEVLQIAQLLAKADAVVTFVSVSLVTQINPSLTC